MSDSTKCPRCGGALPANFIPGVCPSCLMQQGLSPGTVNSGIGNESRDSSRQRSWTPPTPAELTPRFPQLEIIELLGQGGMGAVYKVRQRDLDRWAALKVLPDEVAHDPNFSERFQREARALALLGHQHIVTVYEFGQRDGVFFLLMEYIDGVTLRQAIRARQITDRDALAIVAQICEALQFAHEEGVVHRDIKPENILIDKRGRVKIADFGLAKLLGRSFEVPTLTGTHQVMGTPVYMAPEQMEGTRGVDHRADIFSLGVVFYELLTGELPLGRFAPPSQKYQLDARLDDVVLRTLEKEPDRRYQQASDVKCDVESIRSNPPAVQNTPTIVPPAKIKKPQKRWSWRKRIAVFLLSGVGLFIAMLIWIENDNKRRQIDFFFQEKERLTRVIEYNQEAFQNEREKFDQLLQKQKSSPIEFTSHDPNEVNAIVQFTPAGPRLNPKFEQGRLHGINLRAGGNLTDRDVINRAIGIVHTEFLAIEQSHVKWEKREDGTQISVIQRFDQEIKPLENWFWKTIDSQLPIDQQAFLRKHLPLFADGSKPLPVIQNQTVNSIPAGYYPQTNSPVEPIDWLTFKESLRYLQIFGWKYAIPENESRVGKTDLFPIRVVISRHGNWYQWSLFTGQDTSQDEPSPDAAVAYTLLDSGYGPELPSGLRRFWKDDDANEYPPQDRNFTTTRAEAPLAHATALQPTPDHDDGERQFNKPFRQIEDDDPLKDEPLRRASDSDPNALNHWRDDLGDSPPNARRPTLETPIIRDSNEELADLDSLEIESNPDWSQLKTQIERILSRHRQNWELARIHGKAVEIYGSRNLRWHAADVTRHATEGLKFERDLVERSKLYFALGNAAEIHDNNPESFITSRAEATRWYLTGYAELLPFHLPEIAPELPEVENIDDVEIDDEQEINPERIAAQARQRIQRQMLEQAQFTRKLIERRVAYTDRLKVLFGPLHLIHDKNSAATARLEELAQCIRGPENIRGLINSVIPPILIPMPENTEPTKSKDRDVEFDIQSQ